MVLTFKKNLPSFYTVYFCVLCGSQNTQRLFPYTAFSDSFRNGDGKGLLGGTDWVFKWVAFSNEGVN